MRLSVTKSASGNSYYVIRSIKRDGKRSSEVVEKLGNESEIMDKYHCADALEWARDYVTKLNSEEKQATHKVLVPFMKERILQKDEENLFNVGYLFLQQIYYKLGIPAICARIADDHAFTYDLDNILSRLVYGRILYPSSKLSCLELSSKLIEGPKFELQHIYRALSVLAGESEAIQAQLYKNSRKVVPRNSGILYYDCTNFFFEITEENGLKQYGHSKEHRPNPIVQMGLMMDGSGIPLAMTITPGNVNEQITLRPLEKTIIKDFELSRFIVCTDAGLSSKANRKFNNVNGRRFVTTQSIKILSDELKQWCLDHKGWSVTGSRKKYDLDKLPDEMKGSDITFFKQRFVEGYDDDQDVEFNQTLMVTFSFKHKEHDSFIRNKQISLAMKALKGNPHKIEKRSLNDYRRFIKKTGVTKDGEKADKSILELDHDAINQESIYDGFYAVYTNLDDDPEEVVRVNHNRWEIEESFRIMKSEFKSRPVYLSRDDRISAHFLTCFIALLIYRILEKQLNEEFTSTRLISTLRTMNVTKIGNEGFIPSFTRTEFTDAIHENAGFRTDYEITTTKAMKGLCRRSKGLR